MFFVRRTSVLLSFLGALALLPAAAVQAATFVNPGFETGTFSGWQTIGNTSIASSSVGSGPPEGTSQALLSTAGTTPALANPLEFFLGLPAFSLNSLGNGSVVEGSAIQQTFTATAGELLSLQWNFLSDDVGAASNNDFAFISINGLSTLANTATASFFSSATAFDFETGFQTFSFVIPTTGTYTLGLGVVDVGDRFIASALLVDNIRFTAAAVPEPATVLGIAGFGSLIAGSWRKRRPQKTN
ncbi:PEP-CTERM sorting domain-containing protein [Anthocerotibacter panamensis]|uniref:PEP-CTERM sorting domain-containing protein n=1 Tax=Anthocerotibacter panamensis TaxID=2857077 RepID=UPI001C402D07|nr:PEP-CTERM sorting domain-containing protein [Anthocerotibacter panamensis]